MGEKKSSKKIVGSFELVLVIFSIFAFSYILSDKAESTSIISQPTSQNTISLIFKIIKNKLKEPMIPFVSAGIGDYGCCVNPGDGSVCSYLENSDCPADSIFNPGAACEDTSECIKGCCYDLESGDAPDSGIIESECDSTWEADEFCDNVETLQSGCCILEGTSEITTESECESYSEMQGIKKNWDKSISTSSCIVLGKTQTYGACVSDESCSFIVQSSCSNSAEFYPNKLCTSKDFDVTNEKTTDTICYDSKVYFVDSEGQRANIYDVSRASDQSYWEDVEVNDVCLISSDGIESCGNCDQSSTICTNSEESPAVYGDNYCRGISCDFTFADGTTETYNNAESWCDFDGVIGEGNDPVGSRHWLYSCNQGEIEQLGCTDYRNKVCINSTPLDSDFRSASCITNPQSTCFSYNDEGADINECTERNGCMLQEIDLGEYFSFSLCMPSYPIGFDVTTSTGATSLEELCDQASITCEIPTEKTLLNKCKISEDKSGDKIRKECLTEDFVYQANELCRKIGDCGGSVNYNGNYEGNYRVVLTNENSRLVDSLDNYIDDFVDSLDDSVVDSITSTSNPDHTQYAVLDVSKIADSSGLSDIVINDEAFVWGKILSYSTVGSGVWFGSTQGWVFAAGKGIEAGSGLVSVGAYAAPVLGAVLGSWAAGALAGELEWGSAATTLAVIGGASAGAAAGVYVAAIFTTASFAPVGTILAIVAALVIGYALVLEYIEPCEDIVVEFICEPWDPYVGGNNCEDCNGDPLKPCTKYRCSSLGDECIFLENNGEEDPICYAEDYVGTAPVISPGEEIIPEDYEYDTTGYGEGVLGKGFRITGPDGETIPGMSKLTFTLNVSQRAKCAYSTKNLDFDEMTPTVPNAYVTDHVISHLILDPSGGESMGEDVVYEYSLYIKCKNVHETESIGEYRVDFNVSERPDSTPPTIKQIIPESESLISYDGGTKEITVYTDAPSDCSWSTSNIDYYEMKKNMTCKSDSWGVGENIYGWYPCTADLPIANETNTFYINCLDQPWLDYGNESRNKMSFNEEYILKKPNNKINISYINVGSNSDEINSGEIRSGTVVTTVPLKIKTIDGGDEHICSWSIKGFDSLIEMRDFASYGISSVNMYLVSKDYTVYVECCDETGDCANGTKSFNVIRDTSSPIISRVTQDGNSIEIITTESAECKYSTSSCLFDWEDGEQTRGVGLVHTIPAVKGETYYVKCSDDLGNVPSDSCNIQVVAV